MTIEDALFNEEEKKEIKNFVREHRELDDRLEKLQEQLVVLKDSETRLRGLVIDLIEELEKTKERENKFIEDLRTKYKGKKIDVKYILEQLQLV